MLAANVGTSSVHPSSTNACTTVSAPPVTIPNDLSDEWTQTGRPDKPSSRIPAWISSRPTVGATLRCYSDPHGYPSGDVGDQP